MKVWNGMTSSLSGSETLRSWLQLAGPGVSVMYTFKLSNRAQLESRSTQMPELAFHQGNAYKKLDRDEAKTKGQKESLNYTIAIFCQIRFQLLFSFPLKMKMLQVSSWEEWAIAQITIFSDNFQHESIQGYATRLHDEVIMCLGILCMSVTLSLGFAKTPNPLNIHRRG